MPARDCGGLWADGDVTTAPEANGSEDARTTKKLQEADSLRVSRVAWMVADINAFGEPLTAPVNGRIWTRNFGLLRTPLRWGPSRRSRWAFLRAACT
jgi:hypothetical protein